MDDSSLRQLQEKIGHNREFHFDFDKNTLVFKSKMYTILLIAFIIIGAILNIQMIFLLEVGLFPVLISALITITVITVIFIRSKDLIKFDLHRETITKQSWMKLEKINFSEIRNLNIVKHVPYSSFTTIYFIMAETAEETINLLGCKNEAVSGEIVNWFRNILIKK